MPDLTLSGITASAPSVAKGGKLSLVLATTGGTTNYNALDDQGNQFKISVSQLPEVTVVPTASAPAAGAKAPAGTFVVWSDNAGDALVQDASNPLQIDVVKG